jgi:hypothetical protein
MSHTPRRLAHSGWILALLLALSCKPSAPPEGSPDFAAATRRFSELMERYRMDAYIRPEMDEVLALLAKVPPDSADRVAADAMKQRIEEMRGSTQVPGMGVAGQKMTAASQMLSQLMAKYGAEAYANPEMDQVLSLLAEIPANTREGEAASRMRRQILEGRGIKEPAPEAQGQAMGGSMGGSGGTPPGEPRPPPIDYGTPASEFKRVYSDCFELKQKTTVKDPKGGPDAEGEAWALRASADCKARHPGLESKLVILADGMIVNTQAASTVVMERRENPPQPAPGPKPPGKK